MNFKLPIYTETSPNMQWDDIFVVLKTLFTPWTWSDTKYSEKFESDLKDYTGVKHVILNDSGRTSLNLILKAIGVGEGDEVILPSFTCLVVANAVRWTGATPIYLDTNKEDFNADYSNIAEKITPRTKVILVQHTFGKIVDIEPIRKKLEEINLTLPSPNLERDTIYQKSNIFIIEDWAHSLKRNQELKGDVAFLTFGIEKLISTVRGGAVITNNPEISNKVSDIVRDFQKFPTWRTIVGLLNPIFWWVDVPLHFVGYKRYTLGAAIRMIWRKLGFLGIMIEPSENKSIKPSWYPAKISPALARLGINQLQKLDEYNRHRSKLAQLYQDAFGEYSDEINTPLNHSDSSPLERGSRGVSFDPTRVYLRYPILLKNPEQKSDVWETAKKIKVTLGAWFKSPLYATYVTKEAFDKLCFVPADTPVTVEKCKTVLNLPTSINMPYNRAEELVSELKKVMT